MALLIKCWWYGGLNSDIEPTDVTSPCYRNGSGWDVIDNNTPIYNSASTPENTGTSVATTEGCYGVWIFDEEPTITQDPAGGVSNWFYIKWQSEGQWLVGVQSTDFGNDTFYGDYPSFSTKSEWLNYITNPKDVIKPHVLLKWSDPPNITDWEPTPCNWEGTVVIRKEDSPPMHRWDGIKIVGNKRRDKYKTKGYKDEDIQMGMTYYYGFFPYYTADDSDPNHPLRYYRFTKVIKVETGDNSLAPVITSITVDGNSAAINYSISEPDGSSFASVKLYGKIGSSPACDNTDDIIEDVDPTLTSITCTGLDYETTYYFAIVTTSENDEELTSNVMSCNTGETINNGFAVSDETMLAFDGSNWYNAHTDFRRYNFDGSSIWRDISYSLDLKARYFGMVANNIRFDIKNIQITYTNNGESKTEYLDELLLDSTLTNIIHYNTEVTGAWPACLTDQAAYTCQIIGNVEADNQHLIHFGRPNYNVMRLTYDSSERMYSIVNDTDIHADCYVLPLKKKYHITGISYSCRRQENDPGWGAWKGASISFANATHV